MLRLMRLVLAAAVVTPNANAAIGQFQETAIIKIRQIDYGQQTLSAEIPPSVKVRKGDHLVANVNGISCNLTVTKVVHLSGTYRNLALASLKGCTIANRLARGQRLEKSDFSALKRAKKKVTAAETVVAQTVAPTIPASPIPSTTTMTVASEEAPASPATIRGFQFSVYYPHAENLREVGVSTANGVVDGDIVTSTTGGVSLHYTYTRTRDLGFSLGASYDFPRKLEQTLVRAQDGSFNTGSLFTYNEAISLVTAEANITFGLNDKFYGFGGVNYSLPILDNAYAIEATGDLGFQVGGGYMVSPNFALEASYRLSQLRLDYNGKTNNSIGNFQTLMLSASYILGL